MVMLCPPKTVLDSYEVYDVYVILGFCALPQCECAILEHFYLFMQGMYFEDPMFPLCKTLMMLGEIYWLHRAHNSPAAQYRRNSGGHPYYDAIHNWYAMRDA